tara:strand:- start:97 stop:630 length:534 start_codon:yes stop_codon:yes gene_type:complete
MSKMTVAELAQLVMKLAEGQEAMQQKIEDLVAEQQPKAEPRTTKGSRVALLRTTSRASAPKASRASTAKTYALPKMTESSHEAVLAIAEGYFQQSWTKTGKGDFQIVEELQAEGARCSLRACLYDFVASSKNVAYWNEELEIAFDPKDAKSLKGWLDRVKDKRAVSASLKALLPEQE